MLMNSLDAEVAEQPQLLVVNGSSGKAARNWECYAAIRQALQTLNSDETLLVQSGQPADVIKTHPGVPRVLLADIELERMQPNEEKFQALERGGLLSRWRLTTAAWTATGPQGILPTLDETLATVASRHFNGDLSGKWVVAGGMGGAGGAQPLAATLNGAAFLGIEADGERILRRVRAGYCDICVNHLDEAIRLMKNAVRQRRALSVGLIGNCAEVLPELARRGMVPDILADWTLAHGQLQAYIPAGMNAAEAPGHYRKDPDTYLKRAYESVAEHASAMLEFKKLGSLTFEFGNYLRAIAYAEGGVKNAFDIPGFASEYLPSISNKGRGPLRWVALSGERADIRLVDDLLVDLFPDDLPLLRWIRLAATRVRFEGLPGRACWLSEEQQRLLGVRINELVSQGHLKAPFVITPDHFDCSRAVRPASLAEARGRDVVNEESLLNALLAADSGAVWVSLQSGGASGGRDALNASHALVADGTPQMAGRIERVLSLNFARGILRYHDAGSV